MRKPGSWRFLALLVPFVATLWMPFYSRSDPAVAGFPFFYVWMFAWIVVTALLIRWVYRGRQP